MLCEDLIVCCRGGALLCAKATVQQNNEIEAVTVSNCGMFELLNRILRLVRSVTHVKLNDAGTEGRVRRLKQNAMIDDCFFISRFAKFQLISLYPF